MNICRYLIDNGFEVSVPGGAINFNYSGNWYGCSMDRPDIVFVRGNKCVYLSLQGIISGLRYGELVEVDDSISALFKCGSVRYVGFNDGDVWCYDNFSGVFPDIKFLERFCV